MDLDMEIIEIGVLVEKPRILYIWILTTNFGYGFKNKLYIWVRDVMGKVYLRNFLKSGHVGLRVILLTFQAELEIIVVRIIKIIWVYINGFA